MQTIPLQPIPNQTLQVQLNGQACTLNVFQYSYGLFCTVMVGATLIVASAICQNQNRIIRDDYLGFSGSLAFVDTQGSTDPVFTGFGGRYQLIYFDPPDLAALGLS